MKNKAINVPQAPQKGNYLITGVSYELHNGKPMPMAEVIFQGFGWTKPDYKPRVIRLRGLYNKSSLGPKEQFPQQDIQSLYLHQLIITDKIEKPDFKDPNKTIYALIWDVIKPDGYDQAIQQETELLNDVLQQDQNDALDANELLIDEYERQFGIKMIEDEINLTEFENQESERLN